ncbi:hypothetical protein Ptr902_14226 [Pyrenophora tritici-repentis]|nr:hypothetical protein Ptr902_14226 [Pyrenophora tritici-repentis]
MYSARTAFTAHGIQGVLMATDLAGRSLLKETDLSPEEFHALVELAAELKAASGPVPRCPG